MVDIMVMIVLCNNVLCDILSDIQLFSQQHYTREMSDCYELQIERGRLLWRRFACYIAKSPLKR